MRIYANIDFLGKFSYLLTIQKSVSFKDFKILANNLQKKQKLVKKSLSLPSVPIQNVDCAEKRHSSLKKDKPKKKFAQKG